VAAPQTVIRALDAFFAGRMAFDKLEETVSAVARASPDAQRSTLAHLKELVDVGRLPVQLAHALAGKIEIGRAHV
jgi:hypothetical protein